MNENGKIISCIVKVRFTTLWGEIAISGSTPVNRNWAVKDVNSTPPEAITTGIK
jgi:hypothetical protein